MKNPKTIAWMIVLKLSELAVVIFLPYWIGSFKWLQRLPDVGILQMSIMEQWVFGAAALVAVAFAIGLGGLMCFVVGFVVFNVFRSFWEANMKLARRLSGEE